MAQILEADVKSLMIQPLAIGILRVIGCFVAIIDTATVSIVSSKSRNTYCFSGLALNHPSACWTITFLVAHITGQISSQL